MSSHPATLPAPAPHASAELTPRDAAAFHQRSDALCRAATECCRQRERLAHLVKLRALPAEQRAAQTQVALCDEALTELVGAYERAASKAHPAGGDACWHAANGLWMASREYARRTRTSARAARGIGERHERADLAELALDYDLEASAVLLLKQAAEAYRRARPSVA